METFFHHWRGWPKTFLEENHQAKLCQKAAEKTIQTTRMYWERSFLEPANWICHIGRVTTSKSAEHKSLLRAPGHQPRLHGHGAKHLHAANHLPRANFSDLHQGPLLLESLAIAPGLWDTSQTTSSATSASFKTHHSVDVQLNDNLKINLTAQRLAPNYWASTAYSPLKTHLSFDLLMINIKLAKYDYWFSIQCKNAILFSLNMNVFDKEPPAIWISVSYCFLLYI